LVGVDFSATSLRAVQVGANIARSSPSSELHLVHASPLPTSTHDLRELFAQSETNLGGAITQAREELDRLAASQTSGIGRVTGHIRIGSAAHAIVELALELSADLVVVGASERSGMTRVLLGSVAEKVIREAPCPVLVAREKTIPMWEQIEPPCPDCLRARRTSHGDRLWCERHSHRHLRPHTYHEAPPNYGLGAMTFREI
jgi:nucleotide-binding universal stress UspA family protein